MRVLGSNDKIKLTELMAHHDEKTDEWYLSAVYSILRADGAEEELIIPHIHVPFYKNHWPIGQTEICLDHRPPMILDCPEECYLTADMTSFYNEPVEFLIRTIKEAPKKEMTIKEIEKELGYKIKIVGEQEEKQK